jgi:hypothetical protein
MPVVSRFGGGLLLAAAVAVVIGCDTPREPGIHQQANQSLKEGRLDHVKAEWDPAASTLTLRGFVLSPEEKRRAGAIAAAAAGTNGRVVDELAITTRGAPAPAPVLASSEDLELIDERIHRDVAALFADKQVWGGREFDIVVHAGEVRLTGTVLSQEEKDRVTELVAAVAGVAGVVNRLSVRNPGDPDRSS